jgi:HTH-type transcriptional regulator/antitoxin HigA
LEGLVTNHGRDSLEDEIELLTMLSEKWDGEHSTFTALNPVELLKAMMDDHKLRAREIAAIAEVGKSTISEILHYRKGFSKDIIRKIAGHFKLSQEAFNQPYQLEATLKPGDGSSIIPGNKRKLASAN